MLVINGGAQYMGNYCHTCVVLSTRPTSAGVMIFANADSSMSTEKPAAASTTVFQGTERERYANSVVAWIKMGDVQQDTWFRFADSILGGQRDPLAASLIMLQQFVEQHEIPMVETAPLPPNFHTKK